MTKLTKVVLYRRRYRDMCQEYLVEDTFGMIDPDDVLELLCRGIKGCVHDLEYIRDLVFNEILFQGHNLLTNKEKRNLQEFFGRVREEMIEELTFGVEPKKTSVRFRYVETKSKSGLLFEVLQAPRR